MKTRWILYKCERGKVLRENSYEIVYEVQWHLTSNSKIYPLDPYTISITQDFGKKERLKCLKESGPMPLVCCVTSVGWSVEMLAAYYGKFIQLRRIR